MSWISQKLLNLRWNTLFLQLKDLNYISNIVWLRWNLNFQIATLCGQVTWGFHQRQRCEYLSLSFNVFFSSLYLIIPKGLFLLPFILLWLVHTMYYIGTSKYSYIVIYIETFYLLLDSLGFLSFPLICSMKYTSRQSLCTSNHSGRKKLFLPSSLFVCIS